uniref:PARG catalytic Macro domain-containing protein n=1 Tax=Aegilops tauschii subsp. strangulata TaxID=200361 RepID=A0A453MGW5_AEGTS
YSCICFPNSFSSVLHLCREVNKAFVGFLDQSKHQFDVKPFQDSNSKDNHPSVNSVDCIGVSTGNWGCGAFGGNPEIKSMIQWLAASQAHRPFVNYYTFEDGSLRRLEEVIQWVLRHGWTVGELWHMIVEYSSQRLKRETFDGFLTWLLPEDNANNDADYMCE